MNYLAHAYLSFNKPDILVGNMISDHVKGKAIYNYNKDILAGIRLHRQIDHFTDQHACTREIRRFFASDYGLYSSVLSDIVYDHFLANDISVFNSLPALDVFVYDCYKCLEDKKPVLPVSFANMFVFMKKENWLLNYYYDWGIQKSIAGMVYRAKFISDSVTAFEIFRHHKEEMRVYYHEFFPELEKFAESAMQQLLIAD